MTTGPQINPLVARLHYFANASAFGPAIAFADMALRFAQKQSFIAQRPGYFASLGLIKEGYNRKAEQFPQLSADDIRGVKRQRAWLLLERQRYGQLVEESQKLAEKDAEVMVVSGFAHIMMGNSSEAITLFEQARQTEPDNPRIRAATALNLALQGKRTEAQAEIKIAQQAPVEDQQVNLLVGCAYEFLDDDSLALNHYLLSATFAQGYIEGTIACRADVALRQK